MRYAMVGFAIFAAACAGDAPTAPTSPFSSLGEAAVTDARGGSDLPFRGTLEATETANGALHNLVGTGHATHLGRFALTSAFTVTAGVPPTATASGTATWTAANGDEISTNVTGLGIVTFPTVATTETHEITGGSGRFANVSGTIIVQRVINLQTLASSAEISGTISLGH